jgi:opacity protein-like surface antigen
MSFAPKWSAFVEYDYYSFGHKTLCLTQRADDLPCNTFSDDNNSFTRTNLHVNTVKVGVNYKLFSPF